MIAKLYVCFYFPGEKPFECPTCGKRFSHSGSYSSHMTSKKCWSVRLSNNNNTGSPNDPATATSSSSAQKDCGKLLDNHVTSQDLNERGNRVAPSAGFTTTLGSNLFLPQFVPFGAAAASMSHLQVC